MSGTQYAASFGPQFSALASGSPSVAQGAEVAAYDAARNQVFVLGPQGVDVLDADTLTFKFGIPRDSAQGESPVALGGGNSVAVFGDTLAVAYEGSARGQDGAVAFYDISGPSPALIRVVSGPEFSTPDQIVFTPNGSRLLVAIEGEPGDDYASDARGGVAIVNVATGNVSFASFLAFDDDAAALRAAGVRLTGQAGPDGAPGTALPSRDLEPEYIAVNAAGTKAYVALQENNALGILDLASGRFEAVLPFGLKDHGLAGFSLDASDRDGGPRFLNLPIHGMFQPDGIDVVEANGRTFIVTANEGDAREWGDFVEPVRIGDSSVVLDPVAFPPDVAARLKDNTVAGRLEISRFTGDTDGDGDYDQLHVFGGRSVSIFEVTGGGTGLELVWDSGNTIDATLAASFPGRYDDSRSDNKGAEPEGLQVVEIDGTLQALVGLERANLLLSFEIDLSAVATGGDPVGRLSGVFGGGSGPGIADVGPEVFTYVPGAGGAPGTVIVANEVSGTVRNLDLSEKAAGTFTLQILHASDFEAGLLATGRAANFAAIVDALEGTYANSITLSSGDNFLPGPFLAAGTDAAVRGALQSFYEGLLGVAPGSLSGLREGFARVDIAIMNALGIEASALGNHEFDLGTNALAEAIDVIAGGGSGAARLSSIGALFPYLSANLDFSADPALRGLVTQTLREASTFATTAADLASDNAITAEAADAQISPWTTIVENGETIGVLGATTQILRSISSPGGVEVIGDDLNDMPALAAILQPYVDEMTAQGINKVILLSHLQQNAFELELATLLRGVDVIVAGGSHAVFADATDTLRPGDTADGDYPVFRTGADGKTVAVVNTGSEYSYVGRLVVTFDANGDIIPASVDPAISGAYVTTDAGVDRVAGNGDGTLDTAERDAIFAEGTRGGEVKQLTDAVAGVIAAKDGNVFGYSEVFLDGRRSEVRTEETNLGNLTADANLAYARRFDGEVLVSLKNGGGIRAEIGAIIGQPVPTEVPPVANPAAGKLEGGISQLDIENSLRFNNGLSVATFTAANLVAVVENALRGVAPGATPGAFPQIGGLVFSFDADRAAGDRVVNLAIRDEDGSLLDVLVKDGELVGDAARTFRVVTLSFLLDGGDGWMNGVTFTDRLDLFDPAAGSGFNAAGREQLALAEYFRQEHGTPDAAFDEVDTAAAADTRIQNLDRRADGVLPDATVTYVTGQRATLDAEVVAGADGAFLSFAGGFRAEVIEGTAARDIIDGGKGADRILGGLGGDSLSGFTANDTLSGGAGDDTLLGGLGNDSLDGGADADSLVGGAGADTLFGGAGADSLAGGAGSDVYYIDAAGDVILGEVNYGGIDRVVSSADISLVEFIEELTLVDSAVAGTGNTRANLIQGSVVGNLLSGGGGADTIRGLAGNDVIRGDAGADVLEGGAGGDTLTGGSANDIFRFTSRTDSSPDLGASQDIITDFTRGSDRIQLAFDFDEVAPGIQAYNPGVTGAILIQVLDPDTVAVFANTDADPDQEFGLLVRGTNTLELSDFIF
jgi:2',3'-cyclic-nucleotide 2'-phosphodiesterase (5'-nucleotidase family)